MHCSFGRTLQIQTGQTYQVTPAASIHVIDSHTAGEPTRVVVAGGPELGRGPLAERLAVVSRTARPVCAAVVNEPRGSDVQVGALVCEPTDPTCAAAVIFFNNVGYLNMCGHGTIGLVVTLAWQGRIKPGVHRIETAVGVVTTELHADGRVSVENVPSFRSQKNVLIEAPGLGPTIGDVAWGGNWFFLVEQHELTLELSHVEQLTTAAWEIRKAVNAQGFPEVDHIELTGPARSGGAGSRNFVLCPGKAYDRSPCGTGTSAKIACLAADGKLQEGENWTQESILGTRFEARFRWEDRSAGRVLPTVTGSAFVIAESRLLLDERDPFCWGIRADR